MNKNLFLFLLLTYLVSLLSINTAWIIFVFYSSKT